MSAHPNLGYLFWHAPAGADLRSYEAAMSGWHNALAAHAPEGFVRSWTWRLSAPPWLRGWPETAYLDVYVVKDFAALGYLNAAAPAGTLEAAHNTAARLATHGSGALFALRSGPPKPDFGPDDAPSVQLNWYEKPSGLAYPEVLANLAGPGRSVWLRQLVLGAGPELLVVTDPANAPAQPASWAALAVPLGKPVSSDVAR